MKSPITDKEMILKKRKVTIEYRKEKFRIDNYYYLCIDTGYRFETTELAQRNLDQVYDQYRKRHDLPFID